MNSPVENMPEAPKNLRRICPFLGIIEDPETSLAFPAEVNCCHASLPPAVPNLAYQADHCLALSYLGCPVYKNAEKGPLPPEIRLKTNGGIRLPTPGALPLKVLGGVLLAAMIFFIGWFGVAGLSHSGNTSGASSTQSGLPILPTTSPSATPTEFLPSTFTPSQSQAASETPTPPILPTASSQLPQASCGRPAGWVTYVVRSGDTLSKLSVFYGVSVAQLQNANCMGTSTVLHAGQALSVPFVANNPVYPTLEPTSPGFTVIPTDLPTDQPTLEPTQASTTVYPTEYPTFAPDTPTP